MNQTRVYFNLHKRKLSVQKKKRNDSGRLYWKVDKYSNMVILKDPAFKVSESGRQRVLKEKRKNVHAYVEGEEIETCETPHDCVYYNPYKHSSFVDESGAPVESGSYAIIEGDRDGYSIRVLNKK